MWWPRFSRRCSGRRWEHAGKKPKNAFSYFGKVRLKFIECLSVIRKLREIWNRFSKRAVEWRYQRKLRFGAWCIFFRENYLDHPMCDVMPTLRPISQMTAKSAELRLDLLVRVFDKIAL